MHLTEIYIYPIKSLGGIALKQALVTERGLQYDRRWLLIDENNRFLTQREHTLMALLRVKIEGNNLIIWHKTNQIEPLTVRLEPTNFSENDLINVQIWDDEVQAIPVNEKADAWFTTVLGAKTRLVYMPDESKRLVDKNYAINQEITSFSDAYPLLIIGQEALNLLNSQLEEKLPINRFRPNLVFSGGQPHEEDTWYEFMVGATSFFGVKPCARCVMTTINQDSAELGKEPLKTLATYRRHNNKILFGQNLLPAHVGMIAVGDVIEVLSRR